MSIFGFNKRKKLKKELISLYSTMLTPIIGAMAKTMVVNMVEKFEKDIKEAGLDNLPENYGVIVYEQIYKSDPGFNNNFIVKAISDGARKADIVHYYNLDCLERFMAEWSENTFRYSVFLSFKDNDKLSSDDAMKKVRMMFPMYGDPTDTSNTSGDDRPISPALRRRVDLYRNMNGAYLIKELVNKFSSYNAFIRAQIEDGYI